MINNTVFEVQGLMKLLFRQPEDYTIETVNLTTVAKALMKC